MSNLRKKKKEHVHFQTDKKVTNVIEGTTTKLVIIPHTKYSHDTFTLLLLQSSWKCKLTFFAANAVQMLRHSIRLAWEQVMAAIFFSP